MCFRCRKTSVQFWPWGLCNIFFSTGVIWPLFATFLLNFCKIWPAYFELRCIALIQSALEIPSVGTLNESRILPPGTDLVRIFLRDFYQLISNFYQSDTWKLNRWAPNCPISNRWMCWDRTFQRTWFCGHASAWNTFLQLETTYFLP